MAMWWPKERHPRPRAQRGSRGRTESSESGQGWDARRDPAARGRTCVHCPVWSGSLGPVSQGSGREATCWSWLCHRDLRGTRGQGYWSIIGTRALWGIRK